MYNVHIHVPYRNLNFSSNIRVDEVNANKAKAHDGAHGMKQKKPDDGITIRGVVIPTRWDKDDNIAEVSISTSNEQEYRVYDNAKGNELLDLFQEEVKVTGSVAKDVNGNKIITVEKYVVL